jgi:hypothetical protein
LADLSLERRIVSPPSLCWCGAVDMTTPSTTPSIPTMEQDGTIVVKSHLFMSSIEVHVQEVHVLLCEIPFINENYILPKLCMLLLLKFTKEDDNNKPRLNHREEPRRVTSVPHNCHKDQSYLLIPRNYKGP